MSLNDDGATIMPRLFAGLSVFALEMLIFEVSRVQRQGFDRII